MINYDNNRKQLSKKNSSKAGVKVINHSKRSDLPSPTESRDSSSSSSLSNIGEILKQKLEKRWIYQSEEDEHKKKHHHHHHPEEVSKKPIPGEESTPELEISLKDLFLVCANGNISLTIIVCNRECSPTDGIIDLSVHISNETNVVITNQTYLTSTKDWNCSNADCITKKQLEHRQCFHPISISYSFTCSGAGNCSFQIDFQATFHSEHGGSIVYSNQISENIICIVEPPPIPCSINSSSYTPGTGLHQISISTLQNDPSMNCTVTTDNFSTLLATFSYSPNGLLNNLTCYDAEGPTLNCNSFASGTFLSNNVNIVCTSDTSSNCSTITISFDASPFPVGDLIGVCNCSNAHTVISSTLTPSTLTPSTLTPSTVAPSTISPQQQFCSINSHANYSSSSNFLAVLGISTTSNDPSIQCSIYLSPSTLLMTFNYSSNGVVKSECYHNGVWLSPNECSWFVNQFQLTDELILMCNSTTFSNCTNLTIDVWINSLQIHEFWFANCQCNNTITTLPTLSPSTLEPSTLSPSTLSPSTLEPSTLEPSTLEPSTVTPSTIPPQYQFCSINSHINFSSNFLIAMDIFTPNNDPSIQCSVLLSPSTLLMTFNYSLNGELSIQCFSNGVNSSSGTICSWITIPQSLDDELILNCNSTTFLNCTDIVIRVSINQLFNRTDWISNCQCNNTITIPPTLTPLDTTLSPSTLIPSTETPSTIPPQQQQLCFIDSSSFVSTPTGIISISILTPSNDPSLSCTLSTDNSNTVIANFTYSPNGLLNNLICYESGTPVGCGSFGSGGILSNNVNILCTSNTTNNCSSVEIVFNTDPFMVDHLVGICNCSTSTTIISSTLIPSTSSPDTTLTPSTLIPSTLLPDTTLVPSTLTPSTLSPDTTLPPSTIAPTNAPTFAPLFFCYVNQSVVPTVLGTLVTAVTLQTYINDPSIYCSVFMNDFSILLMTFDYSDNGVVANTTCFAGGANSMFPGQCFYFLSGVTNINLFCNSTIYSNCTNVVINMGANSPFQLNGTCHCYSDVLPLGCDFCNQAVANLTHPNNNTIFNIIANSIDLASGSDLTYQNSISANLFPIGNTTGGDPAHNSAVLDSNFFAESIAQYQGCLCDNVTHLDSIVQTNVTIYPGNNCVTYDGASQNTFIFDAQGNPNATFVMTMNVGLFQITGSMTLLNGARPCNIYWLNLNGFFDNFNAQPYSIYGIFIANNFAFSHINAIINGTMIIQNTFSIGASTHLTINSCDCS